MSDTGTERVTGRTETGGAGTGRAGAVGQPSRSSGSARVFGKGAAAITAADAIDLTVPAGQIVALTGRSGSGKSTLLHLLGAIERADSGSVRVGDTEVTALRPRGLAAYRRTVGFVFQRFHLLPALTVIDNVLAPVLPHRAGFNVPARAPVSCWRPWGWPTARRPIPRSSPAASSSVSRWPVR